MPWNLTGNLLTLMAGHVEKHLKEFIGRHFGLKVAVPTEARRRRTLIGIASGCIIYSSLPAVGKAGVGFGDCFEGFFCIRGFVFVRMKFKGSLPWSNMLFSSHSLIFCRIWIPFCMLSSNELLLHPLLLLALRSNLKAEWTSGYILLTYFWLSIL